MEEKTNINSFNKIKASIRNNVVKLKDVFVEYPVSMTTIIISALILSMLVDVWKYEGLALILNRIQITGWIFFCGAIFTEECFNKAGIKKIVSFVIAAIFAVIFCAILTTSRETIFGYASGHISQYVGRLLATYCFTLIILTIYHMYQRNGDSFESYCIKVFGKTTKISILYSLFSIGIAIVVLIFDTLIFDTEKFELLGRIEIFLAAGIYFPAIVRAFSHVDEEITKFIKVVIEYALFILLMISFVIIYLYIAKILIFEQLPSNRVFGILTFLFGMGLPVWTMTMNFREQILGKIAVYTPFVFAPFIILQIICIYMRISDYGITPDRYAGVIIIIFEILYILIYSIKIGEHTDKIVFVAIALMVISLALPFVNMYSLSTSSQGAKLHRMLENNEALSDEEKDIVRDAYYVIKRKCSFEGHKYIKNNLTEDMKEMLDELSAYSNDYSYRSYSWNANEIHELDISGHNSICKVSANIRHDIDAYHIILNCDKNGEDYTVDLSKVLDELTHNNIGTLENNNPIDIGDGRKLYITRVWAERYDSGEYVSLSISGYILN